MNFMQYYDENAVKAALRAQIEHYFSKQNLVRDIFLRQRMDREGYIPCEMLFGFPRVRSLCYSIEFMLESVADSVLLDVDIENEKIRVKDNWKTWLFPSSDGTLGVPLYTKFPRQSTMQQQQRMMAVSGGSNYTATDSDGSINDETDSDSGMSTPTTPTRTSARSTPSASPLPKASPDNDKRSKTGLSIDAAEWSPSF